MAVEAITPTYDVAHTCGALLACGLGAYASLLLGGTVVRLGHGWLAALAGLTWGVQCVFSLQFVALSGMGLGLASGFDLLWLVSSLIWITLLGTLGSVVLLQLRVALTPDVERLFPAAAEGAPLTAREQLLLLRFLLAVLPAATSAGAVALLALGLVGCLYGGLWSLQGLAEPPLHATALATSAGLSVGVAVPACAVVMVGFLAGPQGPLLWAVVGLEVLGLALFQFGAAAWGFGYAADSPGWAVGYVVDHCFAIVLLVLQALLSLLVSLGFSRTAVALHLAAQRESAQAERLATHLAQMDLLSARKMQKDSSLGESPLVDSLFQVVSNVELFRPYLPDTLFSGPDFVLSPQAQRADVAPRPPPLDRVHSFDSVDQSSRSAAPPTGSVGDLAASSPDLALHNVGPFAGSPPCVTPPVPRKTGWTERRRTFTRDPNGSPTRTITVGAPRPSIPFGTEVKVVRNAALGLRLATLTVLHIKLQGLDFNGAQLNARKVEEDLMAFMLTTAREVKQAGGTIVQCGGEVAIAMWTCRSPQNALRCAAAIQQASKQTVTQVVQCGQYLTGNLGDEKTRAFNVVGPLHKLSELLIPLASPHRNDVLITEQEQETAMYEYCCLPFERIWVEGTAQNVFVMVPYPKAGNLDDDEWIYRMQANMQSLAQDKLSEVWDAYCTGQYRTARTLVGQLAREKLPAWYPDHLYRLVEEALQQGTADPIKCLQPFSWTMHKPATSYKPRSSIVSP